MSYWSRGGMVATVMVAAASTATVGAQGRAKASWLTDGYDKERTSWQRNETRLSPDTVGRMQLLWKVRLDNQPRQMHNLFPALIVGDVLTAQGCGGNPNQFYSYDLATRKVGSFNPGSGGLWPRLGPSIGKDGRVYAGSGDGDYFPEQQIFGQAIIAAKQNPATKAMELQDWFAPKNAFWLRKRDLDMNVTGPVFEYKGREYTAQSSKECRIWLLDTSALGGEDHRTPVAQTPLVCNEEVQFASAGPWGALATWEDEDGTRYVLMPFWGPKHSKFKAPIEHGEVVQGAGAAFKLGAGPPRPQLTPVWLSRNMVNADPVVIANGVVFAY